MCLAIKCKGWDLSPLEGGNDSWMTTSWRYRPFLMPFQVWKREDWIIFHHKQVHGQKHNALLLLCVSQQTKLHKVTINVDPPPICHFHSSNWKFYLTLIKNHTNQNFLKEQYFSLMFSYVYWHRKTTKEFHSLALGVS